MRAPIVLLTDFGERDWFAGTLKGVIASLAPETRVLDLSHGIPPGDVRAGAFALWAAHRHFPAGSIFVAVVDPGVGSPRAPILVTAHGRRFLGPDNGLLSWAAAGDPRRVLRRLEAPSRRSARVSATFHGRDIFAPAAARLARGARPAALGPALAALVELPPFPRDLRRGALHGEIVHVDRFGNAITSIPEDDLERLPGPPRAAAARGRSFPFRRFYAEVPPGRPLALVGSCGLVELALNGCDAAARLGLRRGDAVRIR